MDNRDGTVTDLKTNLMWVKTGWRFLVASLVSADQGRQLCRDKFEIVVGIFEFVLHRLEKSVTPRRVGGDHDVIGCDDLDKRPFVANDVLDQFKRFAADRVAINVRQTPARPLR